MDILNHKDQVTTVNKAVFTSCKKNEDCPPWSLESSKIQHDKKEKTINCRKYSS